MLELLAPGFIYTVGKDLVKQIIGRKRRFDSFAGHRAARQMEAAVREVSVGHGE